MPRLPSFTASGTATTHLPIAEGLFIPNNMAVAAGVTIGTVFMFTMDRLSRDQQFTLAMIVGTLLSLSWPAMQPALERSRGFLHPAVQEWVDSINSFVEAFNRFIRESMDLYPPIPPAEERAIVPIPRDTFSPIHSSFIFRPSRAVAPTEAEQRAREQHEQDKRSGLVVYQGR